jgi:hypothetical protein
VPDREQVGIAGLSILGDAEDGCRTMKALLYQARFETVMSWRAL